MLNFEEKYVNNWKSIFSIYQTWYLIANHIYMCQICAKWFSDSNFNLVVIGKKISFFPTKLPQIWHSHKKKFNTCEKK